MNYSTGRYFDQDTGRYRWAVHCRQTRTWYFPEAYGLHAAQRLAKKMNADLISGGER